ncbi:transposase [Gilvimarinus sp. SDUM040013]|uniref:Transposase n=1 Tax=Gilvimarinus gilvus TaxID=3058038 RepID=A0ABU4S753_9GAMM|nr:transposase [Gilvimarinus sp. SDUM040013]MDX6851499.1 transposase [Gilvimarinus sp. SDUM040013]
MSTVEPVFANMGTQKRLNRFSLRGKAKVQGQYPKHFVGQALATILFSA